MTPDHSRPRKGSPKHRWSWYEDQASATKAAVWIGVATVIVGLLGVGATLVAPLMTVQAQPASEAGVSGANTPVAKGPVAGNPASGLRDRGERHEVDPAVVVQA
jgi:hypothetical protein